MKITNEQLKQIIKEELNKVLKEMSGPKLSDFMLGPGMGALYRKIARDLEEFSDEEVPEEPPMPEYRPEYRARMEKLEKVKADLDNARKRMAYSHADKLRQDYGVDAKNIVSDVYGDTFVHIKHGGLTYKGLPEVIGYGPERALTEEESFSIFFQRIPIKMRRSMSKGSVIVDDPMMETKKKKK